jgi:hypothetical protein
VVLRKAGRGARLQRSYDKQILASKVFYGFARESDHVNQVNIIEIVTLTKELIRNYMQILETRESHCCISLNCDTMRGIRPSGSIIV